MSVRAVWILSFPIGDGTTQSPGRLLFAKTFPTVERQAQKVEGENYVPVPTVKYMEEVLVDQLGLNNSISHFNARRDSCARYNHKPVFEIVTVKGTLWPVVVIEQFGLIYCCLPLVDQGSANRPSLICVGGIPAGISLLMGMADFVGRLSTIVEETHPRFMELFLYLTQAAPFGRPVDVSTDNVRHVLSYRPSGVNPSFKQPAWRVVNAKPKGTLHLAVTEQIRAVQYDKKNLQDKWDVFGIVTCKADLEGVLPEVSFNLRSVGAHPVPVSHLVVHPCTQSADADFLKADTVSVGAKPVLGLRKMRFTPSGEDIILCNYTAKLPQLPIKGYYQMKGETKVEILLELKLNETVKNSFSHCYVNMPFFHRGAIKQIEANPSSGTVSQSPIDVRTLCWTIGQKFPKSFECVLKATIHFDEYNPDKSHGFPSEDSFCVGQNSYAQVFFKMTDYTQTGCGIDQKSVSVAPPTKVKITTVSEYVTNDYKIWNSHGDVLETFQPS